LEAHFVCYLHGFAVVPDLVGHPKILVKSDGKKQLPPPPVHKAGRRAGRRAGWLVGR
jgi:hypothetical protein